MYGTLIKGTAFALAAALLAPVSAIADSIDPAAFSTSLEVGESVLVRKTVTITKAAPTSAPLDVMFVFDVTGSMGGEIAAAQSAANDILSGLAGFGNLRSGSGWYSDPLHDGTHVDLNSGNTGASSGINDMGACNVTGVGSVGCGGDSPEVGYAGIRDAADNASWADGSSRFIIAFGDAGFKTGPDAGDTQAGTLAALAAADADLIGLSYGGAFTSAIEGLDGTALPGSTDPDAIVKAIIDSVGASFDEYDDVTVSDLGAGLPGVNVAVSCVSADTGLCVDEDAIGKFDRSRDRTFEFDVKFTGLAPGDHSFLTHALADGRIVASEKDRIVVGGDVPSVPEPGTLALLSLGLIGVGAARRRRG